MPKKNLVAVKITLTYYGVGKDKSSAIKDAWNTISNDNNFQQAEENVEDISPDETPINLDWYGE